MPPLSGGISCFDRKVTSRCPGPTGWTSTPVAIPVFPVVYKRKGLLGLGSISGGEERRAFHSSSKSWATSVGEVSGPEGVSLAAAYRGLANKTKLGTQCQKNPTSPRNNKILAPEVGDRRALMEAIQFTVSALEEGVRATPRYVTYGVDN